MKRSITLGCAALAALLAGCARDGETQAKEGAAGAASTARPDGEAATRREPGAPLQFGAPPDWAPEETTSAMRKAQYRLPHAEGDEEDGQLVVYFFGGGGGGTLEANLERWASQFEQPDGTASKERLEVTHRDVAGMAVTEASLTGTYVAETAPGSGVRVNEPGWRMLAAIVESDHGPYYVKLVGPEKTVGRWEDAFRRYVSSAR